MSLGSRGDTLAKGVCRGFEPDMIPAAMMAQRIMGVMAHWREYMLKRGKLFRPSHIYTGEVKEDKSLPKI